MFNFLRQIKEIKELVLKILGIVQLNPVKISSKDIVRHTLSSIDLSDIEEKEMTPEQRKEYILRIASFFKDITEPDLKVMIQEQLEFMGKEVDNKDQFLFARGTINGISLVLEKYENLYNEYIELTKPKGEIDATKLFPET